MDAKTMRTMFYFGAFGGMLPTLATLAPTYVADWDTPLPTVGLLFGLAVWAVVGGGVALTNSTPDARQAIFAGVAAPAILSNLAAGATEGSMRRKTTELLPQMIAFVIGSNALLAPAVAQDNPKPPETTGQASLVFSPSRVAIVRARFSGAGEPHSLALPVVAQVRQGNTVQSVQVGKITGHQDSAAAFPLPSGTEQILVGGKAITVNETQPTTIDVDVKTRTSKTMDFLWALGLPRDYKISEIDVSKAAQ